jgi:hypothetical protein
MTDITIQDEDEIPDGALEQSHTPDQLAVVKGKFRVLGNLGNGMLRFTGEDHEIAGVVEGEGYTDRKEVRQQLYSLKPGNLIEAEIEGVPGAREPWRFTSLEKLTTERLVFVKGVDTEAIEDTSAYDEVWDSRKESGPVDWPSPVYVPTSSYEAVDADNIPDDGFYHEAQLIPPDDDGDDTWTGMMSGYLDVSTYFDSTTFLDDGAHFVIIMSIRTRPYHLAYFIPKVHKDHFKAIYDKFVATE